jgi:NMD protein affecting ribosome stability and mRNA decay
MATSTTSRTRRVRKVDVLQGTAWRGYDRRGVKDRKGSPSTEKPNRIRENTMCDACGAQYARRTWRSDRRITSALLDDAVWDHCPACTQRRSGVAYGRIVVRGVQSSADEEAIRRRIANVATRAQHTQPQRRVLSIDRAENGLDVLTTSQKLAHRIVKELRKAFGGSETYVWDAKDGALYATWTARARPRA